MGKLREWTGIDFNPLNIIESAWNKIEKEVLKPIEKEVLRPLANGIESGLNSIGNKLEAVLKDPLPTLVQIGASMVGIPPYVTSAAITAAKGGDFEDIAKSAAISYAATNLMQSDVGAEIKNFTQNLGGDVTQFISEKFDIQPDTAMMIQKAAVNGLNTAVVGGINAAITGKNILDGITSGLTQGVVYSGTSSFFDDINKNQNWGLSDKTLNLLKGSTSTALNVAISGKGDPAAAVGNYIANAMFSMASSNISSTVKSAFTEFSKAFDNAEKLENDYRKESEALSYRLPEMERNAENIKANINQINIYQKAIENQFIEPGSNAPVSALYNLAHRQYLYDRSVRSNEYYINQYNYWVDIYNRTGDPHALDSVNLFKRGYYNSFADIETAKNNLITQANYVNDLAQKRDNLASQTQLLSNIITNYNSSIENLNAKRSVVDEAYEDALEKQTAYDEVSQQFTYQLSEVATRDATIDAINQGLISATKIGDNKFAFSNGMVLNNGQFYQNDKLLFSDINDINRRELTFKDDQGGTVKYGGDGEYFGYTAAPTPPPPAPPPAPAPPPPQPSPLDVLGEPMVGPAPTPAPPPTSPLDVLGQPIAGPAPEPAPIVIPGEDDTELVIEPPAPIPAPPPPSPLDVLGQPIVAPPAPVPAPAPAPSALDVLGQPINPPAPTPAPTPSPIVIPGEDDTELVIEPPAPSSPPQQSPLDVLGEPIAGPAPAPAPSTSPLDVLGQPMVPPAPTPQPPASEPILPPAPVAPTPAPAESPVGPPTEEEAEQSNEQFHQYLEYLAQQGTLPVQWKANPDGTFTYTSDDGSTLTIDEDGQVIDSTEAPIGNLPLETPGTGPGTPPGEFVGPRTEEQTQRFNEEFAKYLDYIQAGEPPPPNYGVQDLGITQEDWDSFNQNLLQMQEEGRLPTQWQPNEDGTFTYRDDDGSTLTINPDGSIVGYTEAPLGNLPGETPPGGGGGRPPAPAPRPPAPAPQPPAPAPQPPAPAPRPPAPAPAAPGLDVAALLALLSSTGGGQQEQIAAPQQPVYAQTPEFDIVQAFAPTLYAERKKAENPYLSGLTDEV